MKPPPTPIAIPLEGWTSAAPDGSRAYSGTTPQGLRLDFELGGPGSWAIARREIPLELPPYWLITLEIAGDAPACELQLKLIGKGGADVWWWRTPAFVFPLDPRRLRMRRASLQFAWGPIGGGMPSEIGAIEVAVASDQPLAGWLRIVSITIEPRSESSANPDPVAVRASSSAPGHEARCAIDLDDATAFEPDPADPEPWLELEFATTCEFGGVVIDWSAAPAPACRLLVSDDGAAWTPVAESSGAPIDRTWLRTPGGDGRFARIAFAKGTQFGVIAVRAVPIEAVVAPDRHAETLARAQPRGAYPRHLLREGGVWAVVGADGDTRKGLLGEDGALEVDAESFTIEPLLECDGRIFGWADAETSASLEDGHLPVPSVAWRCGSLGLRVTAFATGFAGASSLIGRYELVNEGDRSIAARLHLAIRPFQVNPSWQSLNLRGGIAPITRIARNGDAVRVNDQRDVVPVTRADGFGALRTEEAPVTVLLANGRTPERTRVEDPLGFAEALLSYDVTLAAGARATIVVAMPLHDATPPPPASLDPAGAAEWVDARLAEAIASWRTRLAVVPIALPPVAAPFEDSLRASIGWILVNREGPRIQPGPRCYRRSWIRDGTLTGTAIAEMGFADEARAFLRWYAPYQYEDGRVPCAVDRNDVVDRAVEHDSHGQLAWGVVETVRLTGDRAFLEELWPHVAAAANAIIALRGAQYADDVRDARRGLLPVSISHEGYSSHPVHSYWDDFFGVRGLADAAEAAALLGDAENARRFGDQAESMRRHLRDSIEAAIASHRIDFVPGSVELGDFDPTSTAIALDPCAAADLTPEVALLRTFERYWEEFEARRRGDHKNDAYTPYEVRNAAALLMTGHAERAEELLAFLIEDQRSTAWRQWPEVTLRDPRMARFIGDIPHGWVASSFVRSVRRMLVYERARDAALVIAAGVPENWARDGAGVRVRAIATHFGRLSYQLTAADDAALRLVFDGAPPRPPGGFVVAPRCARPLRAVLADGRDLRDFDAGSVRLADLPRELLLRY
jgi:hypothetical protein